MSSLPRVSADFRGMLNVSQGVEQFLTMRNFIEKHCGAMAFIEREGIAGLRR